MKKIIMIIFTAFICSVTSIAQASSHGFVLDKSERAVEGAVVTLKGTSLSSITDKEGKFTLPFIKGNVLLITTPQNAKKEYSINDATNVRIKIGFDSEMVDIGADFFINNYNSTASVSIITSDEISKSSAQSLPNALFGKGLGLTTLQNGQAPVLENASFSIRGLQSLNDNGVLILVDGIERSIGNMSPDEIESVSILKDAAAIAMHGYKARNGIISVRTKRGVYNSQKIIVSYEHAFKQPVRLPQLANAHTYALAMNEALKNDGKPALYSNEALNHYRDGDMPHFFPDVDWVNESFRDRGDANKYNVIFQGGSDKMRYFTMVDLISDKGFLKNTETNPDYSTQLEYSKMNVRSNIDLDISKSTKLQVNLMGVLGEYNRPTRTNSQIYNAIYTLPSAAYPIKTYDGLWGGNATWPTDNPVAGIQGTGYTRSLYRSLNADMTLEQELDFLLKGLKITGKVSFDNNVEYWDFKTQNYTYASDALDLATGDTTRYTGGTTSELVFTNSYGVQYFRYNSSAGLSYNTSFGLSDLFTTLNGRYEHFVGRGQNTTINSQNLSWYVNYSYNKKYIANAILNLSGSNRLPKSARYNLAPTVAVAWVISQEDFLKDVDWIDFLKLRASAGVNYSDYTPSWNLDTQAFSGANSYFFKDNYASSGGTAENRLPMTNILAERAKRYNLGVDLSVLQGITLTVDMYKQRCDNQFIGQSGNISDVLGATASFINAGIVDSKGLEVGIDVNKKFGEFQVFASGKFTYATNKIIQMNEAPVAFPYLTRTGLPLNQPFGLEAIGFFADEADIANSPVQKFSTVKPGDVKYKDQNGDGFIDQFDRVAIGKNYNIPEIYFSYSLGMEYKSFGFDALFQGLTGMGAMPMTPATYKPLIDNTTISNHYYNNRWTPETAGTALFPRLTTEQNDNNYQSSTLWLKDASFLKLRHCEIYYKVPPALTKHLNMSQLKLYVRAMDLILFDNIKLTDPEVIGIQYPVDRSLHIGANIVF